MGALIELMPWAVAGHYPEDIANPTNAEAAQVIEHADAVIVSARSALTEASLRPSNS